MRRHTFVSPDGQEVSFEDSHDSNGRLKPNYTLRVPLMMKDHLQGDTTMLVTDAIDIVDECAPMTGFGHKARRLEIEAGAARDAATLKNVAYNADGLSRSLLMQADGFGPLQLSDAQKKHFRFLGDHVARLGADAAKKAQDIEDRQRVY